MPTFRGRDFKTPEDAVELGGKPSQNDLGKGLHGLLPTMLGRAWHEIRFAERIGRIKKGSVGVDVASLMAEFAEREVAEATKGK